MNTFWDMSVTENLSTSLAPMADSVPLGTEAKNGKQMPRRGEGSGSRPGNVAWRCGGALEVGQCDALKPTSLSSVSVVWFQPLRFFRRRTRRKGRGSSRGGGGGGGASFQSNPGAQSRGRGGSSSSPRQNSIPVKVLNINHGHTARRGARWT